MAAKKYSREVRERAVNLFFEHRGEYPTEWSAMRSIADKLGMSPETLRTWIRRSEVNSGKRDGITTDQAAENAQLKKENRELRRANEILKAASIFFATELDGQPKK